MQASIKTKLLAMCILLVLVTTLSISIAYYFLAKQEKHRESQQRLQIALEIVLDDLNRQSQFYTQKIAEYLQRDETFPTVVSMYLQDRNPLERNVGLRPFLISQLAGLKHVTSVDRLALYLADGQVLAEYPEISKEVGQQVQNSRIPNKEIPKEVFSDLFREGQKLGFRVTVPFFRDKEMAGMLVVEVFLTQEMLEHYRSLSETEINFFAGEQFSLGTLSSQVKLEPEWLEQRIRCNDLSQDTLQVGIESVRLDGNDYYQGGCALQSVEGELGAITVSLSQAIEKHAIQKIFTTVSIIAGTGIIVCVILVSGFVVPTVTAPIISLTHAASEMAKGRLQQTIDTNRNDELGVLAHSFAHMRDEIQKKIAELQQLNEQLEQRVKERTAELSQEKFLLETFMATVPSRIYFKDCDGRITRANMAHARRLGLQDPSEELGKTDFDFYPNDVASEYYNQEQEIIRSGQPVINQEVAYRYEKSGESSWSLITKMPLRDEFGKIFGIFGISRDITTLKRTELELAQYRDRLEDLVEERTAELVRINDRLQEEIMERRRIEDALRLSEEQYRILAENVMDGVVIVQDGVLVFSNIVFATMLGYPRERLLQKEPLKFFHSRSKSTAEARLCADSSTFRDPRWQARLIARDKRIIWGEIDQTSISWHGKPACLLTIRDVTDRKLKEKQLEKERVQLQQENITLRSTVAERYKFGELIGKSPAMQQIYELIVSAAASEVNVLICGESGTGKELTARTIHQMSQRKDHAFVPVNCASIPETLFEREFFGHRKGAFTSADRDNPGLFDLAHQGTLFLDEVTELSPGMQAKLLRVLQDGVYTPLGSPKTKQADVVIVAATNKDWKPLIDQRRLRQDFFYRICVIEVRTPPLRDRKDDLPLLIEFFLERYRLKQERIQKGKSADLPVDQTMLPSDIVQALYAYDWPGNVRELQNVLQRYLATQRLDQNLSLNANFGRRSRSDATRLVEPHNGMTLPEAVNTLERQMITRVLAQQNNHRLNTAKTLGITRRALQYKLKKYGLLQRHELG